MRPNCPVCGEIFYRTQGPNKQGESFYEHGRPWKTYCVSNRDDANERLRAQRGGLRR